MEEVKLQYDLELAEAKRELSSQQQNFERKFMPGTAPGEILDQNHELRERVAKLSVEQDHLLKEMDQMRDQLSENNQAMDFYQAEAQGL